MQKLMTFSYVYGRYVVLFGALFLLQHSGLLDVFLGQNPRLRVDSVSSFGSAVLLIAVGRFAVVNGVSRIWNHLTPVRDRTTLLEGELVDALAFILGAGFFSIIFLGLGFSVSVQVGGLVALASLPMVVFGWSLQRIWQHFHPVDEADKAAVLEHVEAEIAKNAPNFWRPYIAYVVAAIVFNFCTVGVIAAIIFARTGELSGLNAIATSCSFLTFMTLVVFGKFIVGLGHRILTLLKTPVLKERSRHALAYASGYIAFLTFFVVICLMGQLAQNPDSLMAWWAYGGAYLIIALSALIAGNCFGRIYAPRGNLS